jgi:Mrp family chromosome partitioning ATPase
MGKVYDALSRAQNEDDDEIDLFDEVEDKQDPSGGEDSPSEKFNFMRYSLGTTSIVARERAKSGAATAALAPRSLAKPGRDLTVSPERLDPHLVAFNNPRSPASQHYNKLALSLISRAAERGFKRVLVASAQHGEGRTSVTLNLACALARARQRVLVVDCDLLDPSVMRLLGLNVEIGMHEVFERGMPPGAAAVSIRPYGFNVLPTIRPVENPAVLFAVPGFWKMLQSFDADHDFILFDSSPLCNGGDSSLLVRFTDTTLLVVSEGQTSSAQMAKAVASFAQDDILGVVINRARV